MMVCIRFFARDTSKKTFSRDHDRCKDYYSVGRKKVAVSSSTDRSPASTDQSRPVIILPKMEPATTRAKHLPSPSSDDSSNQNPAKKSTPKKVTGSTSSLTSTRKSSKSPGSTDWRLNLQGIVPKWEYLLENKLFTDVVFLVGPSREPIKCHSLVLKMQSRHFEIMLASDNKQDFEIPNSSPAVFNKMLKYLYTDKLEITAEDAMDALILARQFHLTTLQAKCGRIVLDGINTNNACVLLNKSELISDKQLSLKVQEFILQHANQVVFTPAFKEISLASLQKLLQASRTLWKMNEVKILEAVKLWAAAECARQGKENTGPNQYAVAKEALSLIHYNQFTPLQFTAQVVKPKLLPNDRMLEIQSELIEKEETTRSEYSPSSPHEDADADPRANDEEESSTVENAVAKSSSQENILVADDIDQVKYDKVYTLSRYSTLSSKDWKSENDDGTYKITFNASKPVNLVGLALYGHGNGTTTLVDIFIQFMSFDEEIVHLEFETKSELPEEGGEFDVKLPRPLAMNKLDWYTVIVTVNGRIYPTGIGGKRTYKVDTTPGDSVDFYFKNSKGVSGATHVRGQLPKIYFSVPSNNL